MNIQYVLVFLIIAAASVYVGRVVWRQAKSAVKTSGCGSDCGCDNQKEKRAVPLSSK